MGIVSGRLFSSWESYFLGMAAISVILGRVLECPAMSRYAVELKTRHNNRQKCCQETVSSHCAKRNWRYDVTYVFVDGSDGTIETFFFGSFCSSPNVRNRNATISTRSLFITTTIREQTTARVLRAGQELRLWILQTRTLKHISQRATILELSACFCWLLLRFPLPSCFSGFFTDSVFQQNPRGRRRTC